MHVSSINVRLMCIKIIEVALLVLASSLSVAEAEKGKLIFAVFFGPIEFQCTTFMIL